MNNELITSGNTIGIGRKVINTLLSGSSATLSTSGLSFSNIHVDNTLTATTIDANSITSGNTSLYSIFAPKTNPFTGGTVAGATTFQSTLSAVTLNATTSTITTINSTTINSTTLVDPIIRNTMRTRFGSNYAWEQIFLTGQTTDATPLTITHGVYSNIAKTYSYDLMITARQVSGGAGTTGDSRYWKSQLALKVNFLGTGSLIGSVTSTSIGADAGASAWGFTIQAATSFPGPTTEIIVTGATSKTINWLITGLASEIRE